MPPKSSKQPKKRSREEVPAPTRSPGLIEMSRRIKAAAKKNKSMKRLRQRLVKKHGWSYEFAKTASREYLRMMAIKAIHGDMDGAMYSPSPIVDMVWHEHLLSN